MIGWVITLRININPRPLYLAQVVVSHNTAYYRTNLTKFIKSWYSPNGPMLMLQRPIVVFLKCQCKSSFVFLFFFGSEEALRTTCHNKIITLNQQNLALKENYKCRHILFKCLYNKKNILQSLHNKVIYLNHVQ